MCQTMWAPDLQLYLLSFCLSLLSSWSHYPSCCPYLSCHPYPSCHPYAFCHPYPSSHPYPSCHLYPFCHPYPSWSSLSLQSSLSPPVNPILPICPYPSCHPCPSYNSSQSSLLFLSTPSVSESELSALYLFLSRFPLPSSSLCPFLFLNVSFPMSPVRHSLWRSWTFSPQWIVSTCFHTLPSVPVSVPIISFKFHFVIHVWGGSKTAVSVLSWSRLVLLGVGFQAPNQTLSPSALFWWVSLS